MTAGAPTSAEADGRMKGLRPASRIMSLFGFLALAMLAPVAAAAEADLVDEGRDLYSEMCATCHGRDLVNTGTLAFDLRKFPKDDFARFRNSVLNGKNQAMPAWRDKLSDEDVSALWAYVRSGG